MATPKTVKQRIKSLFTSKKKKNARKKLNEIESTDIGGKNDKDKYDSKGKVIFKRGGKLKKKNAGGFLSKAAGLAGPAGMLMQGIGAMRKKRGGKLWSNRANQRD